MHGKDLDAFVQFVLSDDAFQSQLRGITDRQEFVARVTELASQAGYHFSAADAEEAMRANRRQWQETWA